MPDAQTKPTMRFICRSSVSRLGGDDVIRDPGTGRLFRVWSKFNGDVYAALTGVYLKTENGVFVVDGDRVHLTLRKSSRFNVYTD
jgi:hypothetical protein